MSDSINDSVNVIGVKADRESVNISKRLEQRTFAFHNRHTCQTADISKTQNSGAVGDNSNKVSSSCQLIGQCGVLLDLKTGLCDTGSISKGKVFCVLDLGSCNVLDLALPFLMQLQRFFHNVHFKNFLSVLLILLE